VEVDGTGGGIAGNNCYMRNNLNQRLGGGKGGEGRKKKKGKREKRKMK